MRKKSKKRANANLPKKVSPEVKLTAQALHLDWWLGQGINFEDRIIQLTGDIEPPMWDVFDAALQHMKKASRKRVTVRINSFGGSVYEALAIVGSMHASNLYIITEGYGPVMSAAALILAAGTKRRLSHYSWYMWHEMSYESAGRHSNLKAEVLQAEREMDQWAHLMAEFSDEDANFWRKIGEHKDAYFNAQELLNHGVVDELF